MAVTLNHEYYGEIPEYYKLKPENLQKYEVGKELEDKKSESKSHLRVLTPSESDDLSYTHFENH